MGQQFLQGAKIALVIFFIIVLVGAGFYFGGLFFYLAFLIVAPIALIGFIPALLIIWGLRKLFFGLNVAYERPWSWEVIRTVLVMYLLILICMVLYMVFIAYKYPHTSF